MKSSHRRRNQAFSDNVLFLQFRFTKATMTNHLLFITSRQPTHYCENCWKKGSVPLCVANPTSLHFSFLFLQSRQHQGDVPSFAAWVSENGSYAGMSKQRSWGLKMSCDWKLKAGETLAIACAVCWNSLPRLRRVSGVLSAVPPWVLR